MFDEPVDIRETETFFWNQTADWSKFLHDLSYELEFRRVPTAKRLAQCVRTALLLVLFEVPANVNRPFFCRTCFELIDLFDQHLSEYCRALHCCELEVRFLKLESEVLPALSELEERLECEALFTEELAALLNIRGLLPDA